jgi:hypothetical protein
LQLTVLDYYQFSQAKNSVNDELDAAAEIALLVFITG